MRSAGRARGESVLPWQLMIPAARPYPASYLDQGADDHRAAEGKQQSGPWLVLEGLATEAAREERVERPDGGRDGGRDREPAARVADQPAGQRHRCPAAGDEPADDDQLVTESLERTLGPGAPLPPFLAGEEPALGPGSEAAADQVREIVAEKGAASGAGDEQGDSRVGASGRGDSEGDDHCL